MMLSLVAIAGLMAPITADSDSSFSKVLDGKGIDSATFRGLPCVSSAPGRLLTSEKILAVQGSTPSFPRPNIADLGNYFADIVTSPDNFTFFVKGVGSFTGIPDVLEYNNLAQGQVNNGYMNVDRRELLNIECSNETTLDKLIITFREEVHYNYGADVVFRIGEHEHIYSPRSELLLSYTSRLAAFLIDAVADNVPSPINMCNEAALRCTGELFPYLSLEHCYQVLSSLPKTCEPDGKRCYDCIENNTMFKGDTLQCRSLHMLSAQLRPDYHCAHMANISAACIAAECPSSDARLSFDEVELNLTSFDASLTLWMRILEIIFALFLLLLPVALFVFYRISRTTKFSLLDNVDQHVRQETLSTERSLPPQMKCALRLLKNTRTQDSEDDVVISAEAIDIGGCKLTAVNGRSGSGKSTLMQLLCNFPLPHMQLEFKLLSAAPKPLLAYVPQSSDMWPRLMKVRDILLFTSTMQGCDLQEYMDCIKLLQVGDLMDQPFKTLSGGQQQRVHILANLIHPKPCIIFMDEPLSALDEDNAAACLQILQKLPVNHSFVIAIHQMSPRIKRSFDRILEIDSTNKHLVKVHLNEDSINPNSSKNILLEEVNNTTGLSFNEAPSISPDSSRVFATEPAGGITTDDPLPRHSYSFIGKVKSLFYLWHSLFWGWPAVDFGAVFLGLVNAVILGVMGENALESRGGLVDFIPSRIGTRIPVFLLQFIANVAALSAFVVALIYSVEDRKVLSHFTRQGLIDSRHLVFFNFLRFGYYGVIFSTILLVVPLGFMGLIDEGIDIIVMNVAFLSTSYSYCCYVLALSVPPLYASQVLLLTFLPMTLFTGVFFPWDTLTNIFKALHYINPMFWCLTACSHVLLATFQPNCAPSAYPYLTCAAPDAIIEISQLQDLGSAASQTFSAGFLFFSMVGLYFLYRVGRNFTKLDGNRKLNRHQSVYNPRRSSIFSGGRRSSVRAPHHRAESWIATMNEIQEFDA